MGTIQRLGVIAAVSTIVCAGHRADAFIVFGNNGLSGGYRWDAAPLTLGGQERSLNGGLRYSLQGGSYEAYRDLFAWQGSPPTPAAFQQAVDNAFAAWTVTDPGTGLGTGVTFAPNLTTPVSTAIVSGVRQGAEIDLFAATDASSWNPGDNGTRAESFFNAVGSGAVRLTSGTSGYSAFSISGSDITFNNNPGAVYNLVTFQTILTHEIGHSLGLGDVDFPPAAGVFIDDNYNGATSATALATLTNSFSSLIDPLNPAASPLALYNVPNANPGVDSPGVDILMESSIPAALFTFNNPLRSDDFAGRQFLYPTVPEPTASTLCGIAVAALAVRRGRRRT